MSKTGRFTFGKAEKLCSIKIISGIFESGDVFYCSQFKAAWIISPAGLPSPVQVAFSVPKKNFRLSVTRNLIRRRIREAYRKNKHRLYSCLDEKKLQLAVILIFRVTKIYDYNSIEKSVIEVIETLCNKIKEPVVKR